MMTVPQRFQLLGRDIRVIFDPRTEDQFVDGEVLDGETDLRHDTITIHVATGNANAVGHTFYHELVHAILDLMGREDLSADEAFVVMFGGLLWQMHKTAQL